MSWTACVPTFTSLAYQTSTPKPPQKPLPHGPDMLKKDPISIISAVAIALHAANKLFDTVGGLREAPREIRNVAADSKTICDILDTLKGYLEQHGESGLPVEIIQSLRIPLENTCWTVEELASKLKPFVSGQGEVRKSTWIGIRWSFCQKDVRQLGLQLSNGKSTLSMTLVVVNVLKTSQIKTDTTEIIHQLKMLSHDPRSKQVAPGSNLVAGPAELQGFDPRMKNVNFALMKFLETTSTATDSPSHSPWASPTDVAQASSFTGDLDDDDDLDLAQAPPLVKEDTESKIRCMLAKESAHASVNEDGQTALHLAAEQDEYLTRDVLKNGFEINVRNLDGQTPLMCAVNADNIETVTLLLKSHADVDAVDERRRTALHLAALKDESGSITQVLLRRHADTDLVDEIGLTPLCVAAFNGNDAVTRQLLKNGAKPQVCAPDGFTALHFASMQASHVFMGQLLDKRGPDFEAFYEASVYKIPTQSLRDTIYKRRAHIVTMLLEHGADIHASGKGITPLHIAAVTAQESIVNVLLEAGAGAAGVSVICAYWGLSSETVNLLLEQGAGLEMCDPRHGKSALSWTAEIGSPAVIEVLLRHGAKVNHQDNYGSSGLHYASANGRTETVKLLLESGANPNLQDREGKMPLARLASAGRFYLAGRWWDPSPTDRRTTATILFGHGCDPCVKDAHGNVAVHYAASCGHVGVLEVIGANGGDLEALDGKGNTPLERAQDGGHIEVVRILKRRRWVAAKGETPK